MCELFGVSSRLPAQVGETLERLMRRGGLEGPHGDGWGVAFYEGPDVFLLREPRPAAHSSLARYLEEYGPASRCMIAHIRRATQGETALRNTQPFIRELGGRVQVFAHNGELKGIEAQFSPKQFQPVGNTDSEIAFCALLDRLHGLWKQRSPPSLTARLEIVARFAETLRPLGPANFLYADGQFLFAHAHQRTQADDRIGPPGLYLLRRRCKIAPPENLAILAKIPPARRQTLLLFASVPLTEENWQPIPEGTVLAASEGHLLAQTAP